MWSLESIPDLVVLSWHGFVLLADLSFYSENTVFIYQNTKTQLNSKPIIVPDIPVPITHGPRRSYHSKALCHTRSITIQKGKVALQKFTTHFPTLLLQNCNMVGNRVSIWCQISSDNIEKVGFWTVYFAAEESLELDLTRILDATKTAHFLKAYNYTILCWWSPKSYWRYAFKRHTCLFHFN